MAPLRGQARLELTTSLSSHEARSERTGSLPVHYGGSAAGHLRLSGVYFPTGEPWGVAADLSSERFTLHGTDFAGAQIDPVTLTGRRLWLAAAALWAPRAWFSAEGYLGYAYGQLPTADADVAANRILDAPTRYHGPLLGGLVHVELPGVALAPFGELSASLTPLAFGTSGPAGSVLALPLTLGARLGLGDVARWGLRWRAFLAWEMAAAGAGNDTFELSQVSRRVGLGLRAELPAQPAAGRPRGPGHIRGRIVQGEGALPLAGASVVATGGPTVTTDAQGRFTLGPLGPGPVTLQASAPGFRHAGQPVEVPAGGAAEVELVLERHSGPGTIRGVVRAGPPGEPGLPVPDVLVESAAGAQTRSAADGTFLLASVGPGPVPLSFKARGFRSSQEVVSVPPGAEARLELVLERLGVHALASLRGQVRGAQGRGVAATVRIPEARIRARSRPDGHFQVRLPAGRYSVVFEAKGFFSQQKVLEVEEGDQALYYVDLSPVER